jgi:hypothetical protein
MCTPRKCTGGAEVWLHSFLTCAMHEGKWLSSCPASFRPGNTPVPTEQEDERAPQAVWKFCRRALSCTCRGTNPGCLKRSTFPARALLVCNVAGLAYITKGTKAPDLLRYALISLPFCAILTYVLTAWSRVLLEKLTGSQLVKKFPAFHGTRRFITAFTSARHLSLS